MNKKRNPQKRGGFVPIGDVADGLSLPGGRALTHRAATPQARHHFTRLDQIDQLVAASEADADLGFMARLLALCSLPRSNPGNRLQGGNHGASGQVRFCRWTGDRRWPEA